MSLMFGDNISYLGKKPLDNRSIFKTIEEMKDFSENYLPSLAICQNEEDGEIYLYNKDNEVDETTGKWRKLDVTEAESYLKRAKENNPDANFNDVKSLIIGMDNQNSGDNVLEEVSIGFNAQGSIPGIGQIPYFEDSETGRNKCKQYIIDNFEAIAAWKNLTPAEYGVSGGWYVNTNDMTFVPASRAPGTTIAVLKKIETVAAENVNLIGVGLKSLNPGTTVLGKYNKTQSGALIIGNGTDDDTRSDAFVIDQDGTIHASNYYIKDEVFHADMIEDDESKSTFIKNKPIYTNGLIGETGPTTYSIVHNAEDKKGIGTYVITLPFDKSKYARLETEQIRNAGAETSGKIGIIDLLTCTSGTTLYHFKENSAAPTMSIKFVSLEDNILTLEHTYSYNGLPWPDDPFIDILSLDARASFVGVNYDNETITLNEEGQLTANITDDFHVEVLPENPEEGMTVQLIGEDYDGYKKGHIYKYIKQSGGKTYKCFSDVVDTEGSYFWTSDGTMMAHKDLMGIATKEEDLELAFDVLKKFGIPENYAQGLVDSFKEQYDSTGGEGPITLQGEGTTILEHHSQYDFSTGEGEGEFGWVDIYSGDTPIVEDTFHVTTMPETPSEGDTVQLVGEDYDEYKKGHIYKYTSEEPETYKAYMSEGVLYHKNGDDTLYMINANLSDDATEEEIKAELKVENLVELITATNGYIKSYDAILNDDGSLKDYVFHYDDMDDFYASSMFETMGWTSLEGGRLPQYDITVGGDDTLKWVDIYSTSVPISYIEGDAIKIEDNTINVKYDNETIKLNDNGELSVNDEFHVTKLPENPNSGDTYQLIEDDGDYKKGHIYKYTNSIGNPDNKEFDCYIESSNGLYLYFDTKTGDLYISNEYLSKADNRGQLVLANTISELEPASIIYKELYLNRTGDTLETDGITIIKSPEDGFYNPLTWVDIYGASEPYVDTFNVDELPNVNDYENGYSLRKDSKIYVVKGGTEKQYNAEGYQVSLYSNISAFITEDNKVFIEHNDDDNYVEPTEAFVDIFKGYGFDVKESDITLTYNLDGEQKSIRVDVAGDYSSLSNNYDLFRKEEKDKVITVKEEKAWVMLPTSNESVEYTEGDAVKIEDNTINVKYDNNTIKLNNEGELSVNDIFHVEVLPENSEAGTTVQLIGEDYDDYKKGHIYRYIKNEGIPPKIYKSFIYNGNRIWTLDGQEFYCLSLDNPNYELNSEELNNEFNLFNIRLELEGGIGHDSAISACEDLKASFIETNGEGPITMNIGGSLIIFNRDEQKDFIAEEGTEPEEPKWIDIYNNGSPISYQAGDGIKIEDNIISNPYKPQVITQEQYDELTDKTGFYLIRD